MKPLGTRTMTGRFERTTLRAIPLNWAFALETVSRFITLVTDMTKRWSSQGLIPQRSPATQNVNEFVTIKLRGLGDRLHAYEPGTICPSQTWARWNGRSTDGSIGQCGSRKTDIPIWWRRGTTRNRTGGAMGRVGFLGVKGDGESSRRKNRGDELCARQRGGRYSIIGLPYGDFTRRRFYPE